MPLAPGVRLGAYEITALIGAGGMGEVYRARDPRLGRDVAIKILPEAFSADLDRLRRFEYEAKATAALNHPNILAVYDIGDHHSAPFVVSELLDGETLRERLAGGPLPVRKALDYSVQIAKGLAAAHDRGIAHRDLKPENIFITADGRVKILDFGLAKLSEPRSPLTAGTNALTTPNAAQTQAGMILGTIGYMAPEQIRAQPVDHRADLFALGVVLYEMLAGRRAFQGETAIDTTTAILKEDPPDLPVAERHIPPALERIVDRCLEKNPAARFQTANDLGFALEGVSAHSEAAVDAATMVHRWNPLKDARLAWMVAAMLAIGLVVAVISFRPRLTPPQTFTFPVQVPGRVASLAFALSPDGTRIVGVSFTGNTGNQQLLWLRNLNRMDEGRFLNGTESAAFPFWSRDGRYIGFFSGGRLRKVDVQGGPPQSIADAPTGRGGSWNGDDVIIYAPSDSSPLFRVSARGGESVQITELDGAQGEFAHAHPVFLPDGRSFIFLARSSEPRNSAIYVASLDSKERVRLVNTSFKAEFAPPDHIVFVRETSLMAQRFDAAHRVLVGDPFRVENNVGTNLSIAMAGVSASATGVLAHRAGLGARAPRTMLTWVDRNGKPSGTVGTPGGYRNPRISPDGSRIIVQRFEDSGTTMDLWLIETARPVPTRFTFASTSEANAAPIWSPDGTQIAWQTTNAGAQAFFRKPANGTAKEQKLRDMQGGSVLDEWVAGGLLFHNGLAVRHAGLQLLPLDGGEPRVLDDARTLVTHVRVSPDGRWVAFTASDTGREEVFIQDFPKPVQRLQVSSGGGVQPLWRRDGRELYFLAPDGKLMAVPIRLASPPKLESPIELFQTNVEGGGTALAGLWHQYDVSSDGSRFLVNTVIQQEQAQGAAAVTVVVNWTAALLGPKP